MILGMDSVISLIDPKPKVKRIFKKQRHRGLVFLKYSQEIELFAFLSVKSIFKIYFDMTKNKFIEKY